MPFDRKKFIQAKAIEAKNREKWLALNSRLTDDSGIYILTRIDEDNFKYAYIGQAKHILTRLCQHLTGYQHIDLSLKKHGLKSSENPTGWTVEAELYSESELDDQEQHWIRTFANLGYQLRNHTSGSQGTGKRQIDDYRPQKGYHDGIAQGRKSLARELSGIAEKHLQIGLKPEKVGNKVSEKQLEKFNGLLDSWKESDKEDGKGSI